MLPYFFCSIRHKPLGRGGISKSSFLRQISWQQHNEFSSEKLTHKTELPQTKFIHLPTTNPLHALRMKKETENFLIAESGTLTLEKQKKAIAWLKWVFLSLPVAIWLIFFYWDTVDLQLLRFERFSSCKIISKKIEAEFKGQKIERIELNSLLAPLISTSSGKYIIVVGPRGCGKSTAIKQACEGKDGVVQIRIDKSKVDVYELVADAFGVSSPYYSFKNQHDLVKLFRKASARKGGDWVPTIIAEVDRGADFWTIQNVSKALKVIALL